MKVNVTARAINRTTKEPITEERVEQINTETEEIFKKCVTSNDVKKVYESFWNDLNPNSREFIVVSNVVAVT